MQIIESALFTTIIPDKGYKIVNKNNGKCYMKVILGPNDSVDNYGEIIDDKYINPEFIEQNELTIDLLLYSIDELYTLFEPLLAMTPMVIEDETKVNKLVHFYILMIKRGLKNKDEVPEKFKDAVNKLL